MADTSKETGKCREPASRPGQGLGKDCELRNVVFSEPYGVDELDGNRWGGLTKEAVAFNVSLRIFLPRESARRYRSTYHRR